LLVSLHFRLNRSTSSAANLASSPGAPPELFRKAVVYRLTERLYAAKQIGTPLAVHTVRFYIAPGPRATQFEKATGYEGEIPTGYNRAPSFTLFNQDHMQVASDDWTASTTNRNIDCRCQTDT
jgi:hypothetical protein